MQQGKERYQHFVDAAVLTLLDFIFPWHLRRCSSSSYCSLLVRKSLDVLYIFLVLSSSVSNYWLWSYFKFESTKIPFLSLYIFCIHVRDLADACLYSTQCLLQTMLAEKWSTFLGDTTTHKSRLVIWCISATNNVFIPVSRPRRNPDITTLYVFQALSTTSFYDYKNIWRNTKKWTFMEHATHPQMFRRSISHL